MTFRLRAKNLFLTFPKCQEEKEVVMDRVRQMFHNSLKYAVVAREKHQDGENHLHVLIHLKRQFSTSDANFADSLSGQHGNYQACRSLKKTQEYCFKEGDYIVHGVDPIKRRKSKDGKFDLIAKEIMAGQGFQNIVNKYPGIAMIQKKKVEDFIQWNSLNLTLLQRWDWTGMKLMPQYNEETKKIVEWLNLNIQQKREFKQKQLMIIGPQNTGKTSLINALERWCRIYHIPATEDFYDLYDDNLFDLAVLDEFKASKTIQWLNLWLQGGIMNIRKKGSQYLKKKNIPTIILSNYKLHENYSKVDSSKLETLESRLEILEVSEFINIDWEEFITPRVREDDESPRSEASRTGEKIVDETMIETETDSMNSD